MLGVWAAREQAGTGEARSECQADRNTRPLAPRRQGLCEGSGYATVGYQPLGFHLTTGGQKGRVGGGGLAPDPRLAAYPAAAPRCTITPGVLGS